MVEQSFPYLPPEPLKRLHVHDGLTMNTERWSLAHSYHRRRQNLHFQALHQAGIVYGLGVKVIDPPKSSQARFRSIDQEREERRWLEIEPGIAIDVEGNPIVVDPLIDRTYRIAIDPPETGTLTVYVVVSYVEPDTLEYPPNQVTVLERFRFDQKTSPPGAKEIELCRIQLPNGKVNLQMPSDVFSPITNQINLLHRSQAQFRPQGRVRVGAITRPSPQTARDFAYLMLSLPALYPFLGSDDNSAGNNLADFSSRSYNEPSNLFQEEDREKRLKLLRQHIAYDPPPTTIQYLLSLDTEDSGDAEKFGRLSQYLECDLLYATAQDLLSLNGEKLRVRIEILQQYLKAGGVVLVEDLTNDLTLEQRVQELSKEPLVSWEKLSFEHPIRTQPFVFTELPIEVTQLSIAGGLILIKGTLSETWGASKSLPRHRIRDGQELGVNCLYFAWRRRHLTQLLYWSNRSNLQ